MCANIYVSQDLQAKHVLWDKLTRYFNRLSGMFIVWRF